jgi:alkylated DNA repair dioxygenase AlkB
MEYSNLSNECANGVEIIRGYVGQEELVEVNNEINTPDKVEWLNAHEVYENKRGLKIIQNHDTFALKLNNADETFLDNLPKTKILYIRTENFIRSLNEYFPSLIGWTADELTLHLYDDKEVGLSRHRDNTRFIGLIAIISLDGICDLSIRHNEEDIDYTVKPGDLTLLRATDLIESDNEIRPEHSVINLQTPTRLSMMLRANSKPNELVPGFRFNNWFPEEYNY